MSSAERDRAAMDALISAQLQGKLFFLLPKLFFLLLKLFFTSKAIFLLLKTPESVNTSAD